MSQTMRDMLDGGMMRGMGAFGPRGVIVLLFVIAAPVKYLFFK